jgi:DNA-binding NarL/FixJ family response regulator
MTFPANNIKVIVAASHFLTRLGIKTLLSVIGIQSDYSEVDSLEEIESAVHPGMRSFLVIEQNMIGSPGPLLLEQLVGKCPLCKIMVIGDMVLKNCPCSQFVSNNDNQQQILEKFQDFFFDQENRKQKSTSQNMLSERETEVLKEVARGLSNKEIADKLYISTNTVITHRKNITEKLGVKTVSALTVYALINNLIAPEDAIK